MFARIDSKFEHIDGKFATVYWVVGISSPVIATLIAILALIIALK